MNAVIPLLPWRVFWVVAVEHSFTRAAERLHLSQPTVSFHIHALESYYGLTLLHRTTQGVSLTPSGEILFSYAQRLISLEEEARLAISGEEGLRGHVTLGASHTVGEYLLPPLLARFDHEHPGLKITLHVENSRTIASRVAEHHLDFGFVEDDLIDARLIREEWLEDELVPVVGPNHPLATVVEVGLKELLSHRLIVREADSGVRRCLCQALERAGFVAYGLVTLEVGSIQAMKIMANHGSGVAFLSPLAVQAELQSFQLRRLKLTDFQLPRRLNLLRRDQHLAPGAHQLYRFLLAERTIEVPTTPA